MSQMTFLQMCQQVFLEGGISGQITSTQNQTGEALRVVGWVKKAYYEVLNDQGMVWNFLHEPIIVKLTPGKGEYTFEELNIPKGAQWDTTSMRVAINDNLADETFLIGQRFPQFRDYWLFSSRRTVISRPLNCSVDTKTHLRIAPLPDAAYNLVLQYQMMPDQLSKDDDTTVIPDRFQMAVVWKALRHYGMFEAAAEVVSRADLEYKTLMQQLYNDQTPEVIIGEPMC